MKKMISFLCVAAMLLSLSACKKTGGKPTATTGGATESVTTTGGQSQETVSLVFSDDGIEASGAAGCEIDGTKLTIERAGVYTLSGDCADGSVKVKKGTSDVTLILNGLTLSSVDTAPITCGKSSEVTIKVAADTVNTLSDAAQNNDDKYPENENAENAVIKCKDGSNVTLCGEGTLNLIANGKNGIKSGAATQEEGDASLTIRDLTLDITAEVNDAINAENALTIESGTLTILAADDAIHSDLTLTVGADGAQGPTITVTDCYEGLEAANLKVASGDITVHAQDDCLNAANSDLSGYAFTLDISGGTLTMDTIDGDGIDSNGTLTISGGTVVVWSANRADNQPLDADGEITITGGLVFAAGGSAGMDIRCSATQPYLIFGGNGGMMGQTPPDFQNGSGEPSDFQNGNGTPPDFQNGTGTPPERPDGQQGGAMTPPEKPDGSEAMTPPEKTDRPSDGQDRPTPPDGQNFGGNDPKMQGSGLTKGTAFAVLDASGNVVYSGTALCDAAYFVFSSPDLVADGTYTLQSGEQTVATATAQLSTAATR